MIINLPHLSIFLLLLFHSSLSPISCFNTKPSRTIITCKTNTEVRRAIDVYINPNDRILELGSQLSDTSTYLCQAITDNGTAVLVDVKRKETTSGRSKGRDVSILQSFANRIEYHELEQFEQWKELIKQQKFNVLVLDVGSTIGNDLHMSALVICNEFISYQQPRVVIVKSKILSSLAKRIIHSQRLLDGTTCLPKNLNRSTCPILIPCVGVNDYRQTIPTVVKKEDSVLEVGCHYGTTTELLHDAAVIKNKGFCCGVDIGEKIIHNAKSRYPNMTFEVLDAWNTLDLLKLKMNNCATDSSLGYDVVYADIGGLSGSNGLLESLALLDSLGNALQPRVIVIKSLCMKRLASQLIPISRVKVKEYRRLD